VEPRIACQHFKAATADPSLTSLVTRRLIAKSR
jgi:hypothetical protein